MVTFEKWNACATDGGCPQRQRDMDWGRGDRPVISVTWPDAQQYVTWLSSETGHDYCLPSESEWDGHLLRLANRCGIGRESNTNHLGFRVARSVSL